MAETILAVIGMTAGKVIVKKATESLLDNKNHLYTYLQSNFTKIKHQDVRFSISYLIRIKIPGTSKFLLVRGHRIKDQLQPVGGVYKKLNGFSEFEKWGYKLDCSSKGIKTDNISENDLRFRVKGKHALDVINWFESRKDRETTYEREFNEELIDDLKFDASIFYSKSFREVQKVMKVFNYSTFHSCYEVLIYDIVEFIPTLKQEEELKKLLKNPRQLGDDLMIVDISEIERLLVMENEEQIAKIGEHAKYLINEK
ncbi:hypothetical protein [Flavobacterium sp. UMI-01]|uniref:SMODS-associated NUDIX domain-containing protein n=1 Tax=Flavobacterium sp. UMI-01 TaxID=1441053 RepID=UPI001C7CC583|nr:hypothetical protein [Flavobacterium sp. UMI-01]GIZ09357.1 hypothetical protein FUMI01_20840 [Flavobacterium sp. UMI-01]